METASIMIIVLGVFVLAVNALVVWLLMRPKRDEGQDATALLLQSELQDLRRTLDTKIGESARDMQASMKAQLGESTRIVREVTEGLARLGETNRQVVGFAEQLKKLQDTLTNPKQRGVLGEYYLEAVLQNVLPPDAYKMQYPFTNGEIADAVVFVKDKIIPIDSKFSLENYSRYLESSDAETRSKYEKLFIGDLKLRIKETAKYIRPAENTMDFAFMVIPSESIYYDLLTNRVGGDEENLLQRSAGTYKVIIVSPTSFLAYLQTVLQGLRAMQIEESAKEIQKKVGDLGKHIAKYEDYYKKIGNSLATTVNHYNAGYKELGKIDKDVLKITGESAGVDAATIALPEREE